MAFTASDLSVLAYANNFTLWHYTTTDDTVAIETAAYFNKAVDMLRENDLIIINIDTDGTPSTKFISSRPMTAQTSPSLFIAKQPVSPNAYGTFEGLEQLSLLHLKRSPAVKTTSHSA